jgi:hypothetical protein
MHWPDQDQPRQKRVKNLFEDFVKDSAPASDYLIKPKSFPASTSVPG